MFDFETPKFGPFYEGKMGWIGKPGKDCHQHAFGGTGWKLLDACASNSQSLSLLLKLDLSDERLRSIGTPQLSELPVCIAASPESVSNPQACRGCRDNQGLRFPEAKVGRLTVRDTPRDGWTADFGKFVGA